MIKRRQTTWISGAAAIALLGMVGVLVALPLLILLTGSMPGSATELESLRQRLGEASLQWTMLRSLAVACLACGVGSLIAVPMAIAISRAAAWIRWLMVPLGVLPIALPPYLGAALLDRFLTLHPQSTVDDLAGLLHVNGNSIALVAVFALHYFPVIMLGLLAGLRRIDPAFDDSARNLGAGRFTRWWRIAMPLAAPGYLFGATLVVLRILEDVGTPLVLGVEGMLGPQILLRLAAGGPSDPELLLVALLLFATSALVAALTWSALLPAPAPPKPICRHRTPSIGGTLLAGMLLPLIALLALAPAAWLLISVLGIDGSHGWLPSAAELAQLPELLAAGLGGVSRTVSFALATGLVTMVAGAALTTQTLSAGALGGAARFAATAMFAVPGTVLALAYLQIADTFELDAIAGPAALWTALTLVVALKQLPLAQRLLDTRMQLLGDDAMETARNLGMPAPGRYLRITLPALAGALGATFALGALAALLELSAALLLIEDPQAPFAATVFRAIQGADGAPGWAARGLLLLLVASGVLAIGASLAGRRCHRQADMPTYPSITQREFA